ncbi:MAG: phosphoribosyltransferase family protein [bacterium]
MKPIHHQPSPEFVRAICRPECLIMGPVEANSVKMKVPAHLSLRRLFSFPDSLRVIANEMGQVVREINPDAVAGIETSGIPWATFISQQLNKPLVVTRKEKKTGARFSVEGHTQPGWTYVIIDDGMSAGNSKRKAIDFLEEVRGKVNAIVVITDAKEVQQSNIDRGRKSIEDSNIPIHYFLTWLGWFKAMQEAGHISKELCDIVKDNITHLREWDEDPSKWDKFHQLIKKQNGKFI